MYFVVKRIKVLLLFTAYFTIVCTNVRACIIIYWLIAMSFKHKWISTLWFYMLTWNVMIRMLSYVQDKFSYNWFISFCKCWGLLFFMSRELTWLELAFIRMMTGNSGKKMLRAGKSVVSTQGTRRGHGFGLSSIIFD